MIDEGVVYAPSDNPFQEIMQVVEMLEEVVINIVQILQVRVHVSHQEIYVKIMLAPQELDYLLRTMLLQLFDEGFELAEP